jgi:pyroglutamyl-peptidase
MSTRIQDRRVALPDAAPHGPRLRVLLTGFGPFPGAPFNPTGALVQRLARLRRPGLHGLLRSAQVFSTSYATVDRDFPRVLSRVRPDVVLMFGLAARTPYLRIETRARNAVSRLWPDVERRLTGSSCIVRGGPSALGFRNGTKLLAAAERTRLPVKLSRDAGRYLCNYLAWRALEAAGNPDGPRVVAFVHVPKLRHGPARRGKRRRLTADDLLRAGEALLRATVTAARR